MFRRFFWFAIGAGVAVFVSVKIRGFLKKTSPEAADLLIGYELEWPSVKRSSARRSACPMRNLSASPFELPPRTTS